MTPGPALKWALVSALELPVRDSRGREKRAGGSSSSQLP